MAASATRIQGTGGRTGPARPGEGDPRCAGVGAQDARATAAQRGLLCHRSNAGSLSLIRLMDRPVLLTLQRPGERPALAALGTLEVIWVYNEFFWPLLLIAIVTTREAAVAASRSV